MPHRSADVAVGTAAASMPWWATSSQDWFVWIGAAAGAVLAVGRLAQFAWEIWVKAGGRGAGR